MSEQSTTTVPRRIVLGSTSRYRHDLLTRLRLPFDTASPDVDETPRPGEVPAELATRLAMAKARDVANRYPDAVVIGSDQVADLDGNVLRLGSDPRVGAEPGEWLDMHGVRWAQDSFGAWQRAD